MSSDHLSPSQFAPKGDADAKDMLLKQLKKDFDKADLAWLKDDRVRVERPQSIDPSTVEYENYPEWRASKQLKAVQKTAKKILKGKSKPAFIAEKPDGTREIIDGHHHFLGSIDAKKKPKGFIAHVPSQSGPWDTLHDKQHNDTRKDDFGKTDSYDRND